MLKLKKHPMDYDPGKLPSDPRAFLELPETMRLVRLSTLGRMKALLGTLLVVLAMAPAVADISGTVFRDYNANGVRDSIAAGGDLDEPGFSSPNSGPITVTAYAADGSAAANTTTGSDGTYSLTIAAAGDYRIEFTGLPDFLEPGPAGADSETTVFFADNGATGVDVGVADPSQYVDSADTVLAANRGLIHNQDQYAGTGEPDAVIVRFNYDDGCRNFNRDGDCNDAAESGAFYPLTDSNWIVSGSSVGQTYGMAAHGPSGDLFASAYMRRHGGFRTRGDTGLIFRAQDAATAAAPAVSVYVDFDALGFDTGDKTTFSLTDGDPHPSDSAIADTWRWDEDSFDWAGKMSFGDMAMAPNSTNLWIINLYDRRLYSVPVQDTPLVAADIDSYSVSYATGTVGAGAGQCPDSDDLRPFAVEVHDGLVYVGITCTAESTVPAGISSDVDLATYRGDVTKLRGYVYSFDPSTTTWTEVLNFPLNYPRDDDGAINDGNNDVPADWNPWIQNFAYLNGTHFSNREVAYPQPLLSGIAFDGNDMIIGIRDRYGDQTGYRQYDTSGTSTLIYSGDAAGDILRACYNGSGWTLESNATCGATTTAGANTGEGPGPGPGPINGYGEFYFHDDYASSPTGAVTHSELSFGGLAQVPGKAEVIHTTMKPVYGRGFTASGGLVWFDNSDGTTNHTMSLYESRIQPPATSQGSEEPRNAAVHGKANGLGTVELLPDPAPIEIGNRVWEDANGNGRQDPGEPVLGDVVVQLIDTDGTTVLGTATTDANGNFLFSSDPNGTSTPSSIYNITDLLPDTTGYEIRIDTTQSVIADANLSLTQANAAGTTDLHDSDATQSGNDAVISVGTGLSGANDHTLDFGFTALSADLQIVKTAAPDPVSSGENLTYTLSVTNNGPDAATDVVVTDSLLPGVTWVSTTPSQGSCSAPSGVTCELGTIGNGNSATVTIVVTVD